MLATNKTITKGFIIAGIMNFSVILFSRFFTNTTINEADPVVMSNFGLLMIIIWGITYIAVSKNYAQVKWLVGAFAIEKFIYGIVWIKWILNNSVSDVFAKDIMAGAFYSVYGINDWVFCIFFSLVFLKLLRGKKNKPK